jgi:hypothetical protein
MAVANLIVSKLNGNVIDILGGSSAAATPLDAYPRNTPFGSPDQLWNLVPDPLGTGYFFIQSVMNGFVIDVLGNSPAPGTPLDAYPVKTSGTQNQLWNFVPDPAGTPFYFIQSLVGGTGGNVIDILGASTEPAARLDAYSMKTSNYDNQLWQLQAVPTSATAPVLVTALCYPNNLGEGGPKGAPFIYGVGLFVLASQTSQAPPQSEIGSTGQYLVSVASGTNLTINTSLQAAGYGMVNSSGGSIEQFASTYTSPATVYIQPPNVINDS